MGGGLLLLVSMKQARDRLPVGFRFDGSAVWLVVENHENAGLVGRACRAIGLSKRQRVASVGLDESERSVRAEPRGSLGMREEARAILGSRIACSSCVQRVARRDSASGDVLLGGVLCERVVVFAVRLPVVSLIGAASRVGVGAAR